MCFLYRQSISIVYESKFKYIYRYFIKIDRCFCGILQSLPLRKCGLKYFLISQSVTCTLVTSLAEVWIEILSATFTITSPLGHFPCGSVDWNWRQHRPHWTQSCHFPCGSVDWNPQIHLVKCVRPGHFPCGSVDWNLMLPMVSDNASSVTSLAEVWIEIRKNNTL